MAITDPRILVPILEDTAHNVNRAKNDCRVSLDKALTTQRNISEHFDRFQQRSWFLGEQVSRDAKDAADTLQAVDITQSRAIESNDIANRTMVKARQILLKAERATDYWESEVERSSRRLEKAKDWVYRAEQRCEKAEHWVSEATERVKIAKENVKLALHKVQLAENRLDSAHSAYSSAQAAYETCTSQIDYVTDSDGNIRASRPDCSGYAAAVRQAQFEVRDAEIQLRKMFLELEKSQKVLMAAEVDLNAARDELIAARDELIAARKELAAAQDDLKRCQVALKKAQHAVQLSISGTNHATLAVDLAEQAIEAALHAHQGAEQVLEISNNQTRLMEDLVLLVKQSEISVEQGILDGRQADTHSLRAIEFAHSCDHNLARRIDLLNDLEKTNGFF